MPVAIFLASRTPYDLLSAIFCDDKWNARTLKVIRGGIGGKNVSTLLFGKMTEKFRKIPRKVAAYGTAPPAREAWKVLKR